MAPCRCPGGPFPRHGSRIAPSVPDHCPIQPPRAPHPHADALRPDPGGNPHGWRLCPSVTQERQGPCIARRLLWHLFCQNTPAGGSPIAASPAVGQTQASGCRMPRRARLNGRKAGLCFSGRRHAPVRPRIAAGRFGTSAGAALHGPRKEKGAPSPGPLDQTDPGWITSSRPCRPCHPCRRQPAPCRRGARQPWLRW